MMPLTLANIGDENLIRHVGGSADVRKHLEDMGFIAGANVTVDSAFRGNLIVSVKETRVALSRELASKIMV